MQKWPKCLERQSWWVHLLLNLFLLSPLPTMVWSLVSFFLFPLSVCTPLLFFFIILFYLFFDTESDLVVGPFSIFSSKNSYPTLSPTQAQEDTKQHNMFNEDIITRYVFFPCLFLPQSPAPFTFFFSPVDILPLSWYSSLPAGKKHRLFEQRKRVLMIYWSPYLL